MSKLCGWRGDPTVACDGEIERPAKAITVDGGYRHLRKGRYLCHQLLPTPGKSRRVRRGDAGDLAQIGTRGKYIAGPRKDQTLYQMVARVGVNYLIKLIEDR